MLNEKEKEYVKSVCGYVKWQRAHENIKEELSAHIEDAKEAFLNKGMNEQDASDAAVAEMGDAVLVGSRMNAAYKEGFSLPLLAVFIAIVAAGCVLRAYYVGVPEYIASGIMYGEAMSYIASLIIGVGIFLALWRLLRLDHIMNSAWLIVIFYTAVMLTLFFGTFTSLVPIINGRASVTAYAAILQPVVFSLLLYKMRKKGYFSLFAAFIYCAVTLMPVIILPQIFAFLTVAAADILILLYAIHKKWLGKNSRQLFIAVVAVIAAVMILFLLTMQGYRLERLYSYLGFHNSGDYFVTSIRDIIGNCSFFGGINPQGLLPGSQELIFFANASSDYMLTMLAINIGLCIFFITGAPLCFMSFLLIKKAIREKSMFCRLLMLACAFVFTIQWCAYFATNLGIITAGTLPLPFLSEGNTSFVINMLIMGLMFCVYSTGSLYPDKAEQKNNEKLETLA